MRKSILLFYLCFIVGGLLSFTTLYLNAQTVDSTGLFPAIKSGSTDTIVHASVVYYDVDNDNVFDAVFTLSAGPVTAWGQYSVAAPFYSDGIYAYNTSGTEADTLIGVVPGEKYDLWIDVDMDNLNANYWVKAQNMDYAALILSDGGFRRTDIDSIARWSAIHNSGGEPDSLGSITFELAEASDIPGIDIALLSGLTVDVGNLNPEFDAATTSYNLVVPYGTTTVNVKAITAVYGASVSGTGAIDVSSGSGTASVLVTSYDGSTTQTYTVNITVTDALDDALLSELSVDAGALDPIFHYDSLSYTVIVPVGTASVDVSATPNYSGASVSGDGTVTLTDGSATADIVVTSAGGTVTRTYSIDFVEADGNNYAMYLPGGDGNNSNIDISGLGINTLPYTIEMWIKPEGDQIDNTGLIYHRSTGNSGIQYASGWQGSGKLRFMSNIGSDYGTLTDEVSTDAWHHVAAVLTDTTRIIYLDGKKYKQSIANTDYDFSDGSLYIGWDVDGDNRAFKGVIDEVRIWSIYKDSATIVDNKFAELNGDETGLAGYWNFNLKNVSQAVDLTSNLLHGTITGGEYVYSFDPSDASLAEINISAGALNPDFNPDSLNYDVVLPAGTDTVFVSALTSSPLAGMVISDTVITSSGSGTATIKVTSFDGATTRTYVISFKVYDGSFILTHSYTFEDGTANDEVGGAHGTIVGGTILGGIYTADEEGEYIELPASDIKINQYPEITLELFITAGDNVNGNNVMTSYFGNTTGDYGTNYYFTSHKSRAAISCNNTGEPWNAETGVTGTTIDDGNKHHFVSTLTNDSISWYVDGTFIGKEVLSEDNKIYNLSTDFAYLCKSGYVNDKTWLGSIHEFNIYSGQMDSEKIKARADSFTFEYSHDATLSSLTVNTGFLDPDFDSKIYAYLLAVPFGTSSVTFAATASHENAIVGGDNGTFVLDGGVDTAKISVTAEDGATKHTYSVIIKVQPTFTEEPIVSDILVYPNVASNGFNVHFGENIPGIVEVFNCTGQLVARRTASAQVEHIPLSRPGVYVVRVEGTGYIKTVKVTIVN